MARRRYFIFEETAWILAEIRKAAEDISAGTTAIGGAEGDASFQEQQGIAIKERFDDLGFELYCRDPVTYPRVDFAPPRVTRGVIP